MRQPYQEEIDEWRREGDALRRDLAERRERNLGDPDFDVPPRSASAEFRRGAPVTTPWPVVRQPPTVSTQTIDARIRLALRAVGESMAEAAHRHDGELEAIRSANVQLLARIAQLEANAAGRSTNDSKVLGSPSKLWRRSAA